MTMPTPVTIIYHADCLDGFGAAYAAWRVYGTTANYRPLHHGEAWEMAELTGHTVFILDFSFAPEVLECLAGIAHSVTQIDHHASALDAWAGKVLPDAHGQHCYKASNLPLQVIFDLDKSGSRLAWEYFHQDKPIPLLIQHIEEQDLWRFTAGTRAFCRALRLLPFEFAPWHQLAEETGDTETPRYREVIAQGMAIEQYFQREVTLLAQSHLRTPAHLRGEPVDALQARRHGQAIVTQGDLAWMAISGTAINANMLFASELGNALAEQSGSFGLVWQYAEGGEIKVSLRSRGKSLDMAVIATRYGGGGHPNAAGFRMPAPQFFSEILANPLIG